jgi:hypothetical protein
MKWKYAAWHSEEKQTEWFVLESHTFKDSASKIPDPRR